MEETEGKGSLASVKETLDEGELFEMEGGEGGERGMGLISSLCASLCFQITRDVGCILTQPSNMILRPLTPWL